MPIHTRATPVCSMDVRVDDWRDLDAVPEREPAGEPVRDDDRAREDREVLERDGFRAVAMGSTVRAKAHTCPDFRASVGDYGRKATGRP